MNVGAPSIAPDPQSVVAEPSTDRGQQAGAGRSAPPQCPVVHAPSSPGVARQPEAPDASVEGIDIRDRLRGCLSGRGCQAYHVAVLLFTLVLLILTLVGKSVTRSPWYAALEGIVVISFACDVGLRVAVQRRYFFYSKMNVAEAVLCVVCLVSYIVMVARRDSNSEEHEVFLGLRYVAQMLRVSFFIRAAWQSVAQDPADDVVLAPRPTGVRIAPSHGRSLSSGGTRRIDA